MLTDREAALLVLEDGAVFQGRAYGQVGRTVGEAVFCTAMTGYQETLTDPSYHRQIVIMTAPHIGITGVNDEDDESSRVWPCGFVVRDPARRVSNWRSNGDLESFLRNHQVVGICEVDTRALTRHLRSRGAMRSGIFSGRYTLDSPEELIAAVRAAPLMSGAALIDEVSTKTVYGVPAPTDCGPDVATSVNTKSDANTKPPLNSKSRSGMKIVVLDLGVKSATPRQLAQAGAEVVVVPASTDLAQMLELSPDGVLLSNGPGDPETATAQVKLLRGLIEAGVPIFGICLGHQILGRALGLSTYKLPFGHRGINQPVIETATGRVEITAQNHGFAVDAPRTGTFSTPYGAARVSHVSLNDDVVQGLECLEVPAMSVQFHPEACAGPNDASHLFNRFLIMAQEHNLKVACPATKE